MTERAYKLKKVPTPRGMNWVTATYAVLVNDRVIGHVDKWVQATGLRGVPTRKVATFVCWGWRVPHVKEDPCGYDRRIDAIVQVMQAAIVPRETSTD